MVVVVQDVVETSLALDHFRRACDSGRGAVFLSVARGKVRRPPRPRDCRCHRPV